MMLEHCDQIQGYDNVKICFLYKPQPIDSFVMLYILFHI